MTPQTSGRIRKIVQALVASAMMFVAILACWGAYEESVMEDLVYTDTMASGRLGAAVVTACKKFPSGIWACEVEVWAPTGERATMVVTRDPAE